MQGGCGGSWERGGGSIVQAPPPCTHFRHRWPQNMDLGPLAWLSWSICQWPQYVTARTLGLSCVAVAGGGGGGAVARSVKLKDVGKDRGGHDVGF